MTVRNLIFITFSAVLPSVFLINCGPSSHRKNTPPIIVYEIKNPCKYPPSIKKALEKQLEKKCSNFSERDLTHVKKIKIDQSAKAEENPHWIKGAKFPALSSITELDLSGSQEITELPIFVMDLKNLKTLNISNTGIKDLDESLCQLTNLKTLIGSNNSYKGQEPPRAIYCLSNLKSLDMSYSSIRYIDEEIYYLKNLEILKLAGNLLENTPKLLHLMPRLLMVDFRGNKMKDTSYLNALLWDEENKEPLDPELNALYDCRFNKNQEDCQKDLLKNYECSYWRKQSFQRGKPLERFTEMSDEEWAVYSLTDSEFENSKENSEVFNAKYGSVVKKAVSRNLWYLYWLRENADRFLDENDEILSRTINGKTIREWRLANSIINKILRTTWFSYNACQYVLGAYDTGYLPSSHEIFPERYKTYNLDLDRPAYCKYIKKLVNYARLMETRPEEFFEWEKQFAQQYILPKFKDEVTFCPK